MRKAPVISVWDTSPGVHFGSWIRVTLPLSFLCGDDNSRNYFLFVNDVLVKVNGRVVIAAVLHGDGRGRGGGAGGQGHSVEGDEAEQNDHQGDEVERGELREETGERLEWIERCTLNASIWDSLLCYSIGLV